MLVLQVSDNLPYPTINQYLIRLQASILVLQVSDNLPYPTVGQYHLRLQVIVESEAFAQTRTDATRYTLPC